VHAEIPFRRSSNICYPFRRPRQRGEGILEFRESAFNPRRCTQATNSLQYYCTVLRVDFAEIFLQCNIITQFPLLRFRIKATGCDIDLSHLGVVLIFLLSTSRQLFVFSQFKCGNATAEVLILFRPRQASPSRDGTADLLLASQFSDMVTVVYALVCLKQPFQDSTINMCLQRLIHTTSTWSEFVLEQYCI